MKHTHKLSTDGMRRVNATLALLAGLCPALSVAADDPPAGDYASDRGLWSGDHFKLRTVARVFTEVGAASGTAVTTKCAAAGSIFVTNLDDDGTLYLRFLDVARNGSLCPADQSVEPQVQYKAPKASLQYHDMKRSGFTFGGLVVPFKFRLGSAKEIVSSATIAPYFGYRTGWFEGVGLTFTPVLSAGLGLVPVVDTVNGSTSTKAAFSTAVGFVIGSSKNDAFQAGFLLGRDYLGRTDRQLDPSVSKVWASFYVGYALADR
ncbi:MAG: hypothetical protein EOP36_07015 [Rubrivivax sp.]|nr:MAG: hypothetical protein EOP36_07015 [Rubrivivax sp.]